MGSMCYQMVKTAFIFPGQGAQYAGMGKDIFNHYRTAREIFEEADSLLDFDLIKTCFEGSSEQLSRTDISQPAIFTLSIALLKVFQEFNSHIKPQAVAGLSLGEYSALTAAGSFTFKDAVRIVRKRGLFMEEVARQNPGKMLCILGIDKKTAEEICRDSKTEIANLNCAGQIVISGTTEAIENAEKSAKEKGAKKTIYLEVSGPFHSSLMKSAESLLKKELDDLNLFAPRIPFISNITANYENNPEKIKENLITQVAQTTKWHDSMMLLINDGFEKFYEIGPGNVLKGLMKKINSSISVISIENSQDIIKNMSV